MKKAVQRLLSTRPVPSKSLKKSLKIDAINLIQDYFIELDEPHKTWSPGDSITGVVVLDLKKNAIDVNITLTLVGYIKIKQGPNTSNVRNKPSVLFRHTSTIYGFDPNDAQPMEEPVSGLSRGEHRFPFSMKLPKKNIYTSISFEKGSISYSLRASINHNTDSSINSSSNASPCSQLSESTVSLISPNPKNSIQHCDKDINIIVPINVAKIPKPQTKHAYIRVSDKKLFKTVSSTSTVNSQVTQTSVNSDHSNESGSNTQPPSVTSKDPALVKLSVDLPQSGFLRGELVPIKVKVSHYKAIQSSSGVIVTLMRLCRVDTGPETPIQSFRKDLCQTIAPLYIDPVSLTGEVSTSLRVPADAFPTIVGSEIVSFQYYVEILANLGSKSVMRSISGNNSLKGSQKLSSSIVFDMNKQDQITNEDRMINVDILKRSKNSLGLNTEIIVGTERTFRKRAAKTEINENVAQPVMVVDTISQSSISPISMSEGINGTQTSSRSNEIPLPEIPKDLTEKEALRLREEALLPSEPNFYNESSPAPSYIVSTAPPSNEEIEEQSIDKAEIERTRLMGMESDPPEFDYVPEYPVDYTNDETTESPNISVPPMPTT